MIRAIILWVWLLATLSSLPHAARAADPAVDPDRTDPASIRQQQPAFLVRAEVNHVTGHYHEGDYLEVRVASEEDAYIYVLYRQADGQVLSVFPNVAQPNNRIQARQAVQIPAARDQFRWQIGAPFGPEMIKVIASKEPLKNFDVAKLAKATFTPVNQSEVKGIGMELDSEVPQRWAEADVRIETHPREWAPDGRPKRRLGVFFGVSNYQYNAEVEAATNHGWNLGVCHEDANQLAQILRETGELGEHRVYTNERATKKNLEDAITNWLPKMSRPGDTVVIYFSGHGGQTPDDAHDEADHKDEFLLPYDYLDLTAIVGMKKQAAEGRLDPANKPILDAALGLIQRLGSDEAALKAANDKLVRTTGITDDLFGHWLQKLDGRQVIVVLDICHAGGFVEGDQGKMKDLQVFRFDFLDKELGRLKDIGQGDTCVLAACAASEKSQVRQEHDLSVLTYFLLQSIRKAEDPLTIENAHQECQAAMQDYFVQQNRKFEAAGVPLLTPHLPQLNNFCRQPVLIKP